jgi:UDP-N-acetylmuramate dehydrogenase
VTGTRAAAGATGGATAGTTAGAARPAAAGGWAAVAAEIARTTGVKPRRDEPLSRHTTMRVGGPADLLAVAHDAVQLAALVRFARGAGLPHVVIGRGSNLVVSDAGIRGLAILSRAEGCRVEGNRLIAEAGVPLARAATLALRAGLSGLEFGLAIPGTVGGAVWANAGAHGSDIAAVLESARVLRGDGTEADESAAALGLAYRDSRLKHPAGQGNVARPAGAPSADAPTATEIVLAVSFSLTPADPATIKARFDEIRLWRREHQPLNLPSAGSIFRNPPGDSAGRLIEAAHLKGARVGGAAISERHANFIVNDRGATAADVRRLAEIARAEVARRFGVELVYEVQFMGDWSGWGQEER